MSITFGRLGLAVVILGGLVATGFADDPVVTIKSDTFSDGIQNNSFWTWSSWSGQAFHETSGRVNMYRNPSVPGATQIVGWDCAYYGYGAPWTFDVRVTVRIPHKIKAPAGDGNDSFAAGLGIYFYDKSHWLELLVEDTMAGRNFVVSTADGGPAAIINRYPIYGAGNLINLRITAAYNGRFKIMWQNFGASGWQKVCYSRNPPGPDSVPYETYVLRPFLVGSMSGGVSCPAGWNVYLDNFLFIYKPSP